MAKKNKDDEFDKNDDINDGRSDDLNNADDNFGLPDVEYTPVNRDEPETVKEETSDADTTHTDSAYTAAAAGSTSASAGHTYQKDESYTRYGRKEQGSNGGKIIAILLVLLIAAVGIWYFGIHRPQQEKLVEQEQREQKEIEEAARIQRENEERERQRIEQERLEAERLAAEAEAEKNRVGTTETISSRTGRYYVVVASALDEDLAMDYAKKMNADGTDIKIIEPFGKSKFHRVAVADFGSWDEAQAQADNIKGQYGNEVWVIKY